MKDQIIFSESSSNVCYSNMVSSTTLAQGSASDQDANTSDVHIRTVDGEDSKISSINCASATSHLEKTTASLAHKTSGSLDLESGLETPSAKRGTRVYRWFRWNFFSAYRRLFTITFAANIASLIAWVAGSREGLTQARTLNATAVNLLLAILMRQEHVVNLLFIISSALPTTAPLLARKWLAKVYSYGGLHSGCGVAATFWYFGFFYLVSRHLVAEPHTATSMAVITYLAMILLIGICVSGYPLVRQRFHDYFELMHRFAGWTVVGLFWAQIILLSEQDRQAQGKSLGIILISTPAFWCIIIVTACIFYPWIRLRRRQIVSEVLSTHAIRLRFSYTDLDYCMGVRLTSNPLFETHSFATIPNFPRSNQPGGEKGFSVVISKAGDWTSNIISQAPRTIYTKGAPTYGVLRIAKMFNPVLVVATGSGIGPCMSLFNGYAEKPVHILWSTRNALKTYGQGMVSEVLRADPNAVIWDTDRMGRPDMVALCWTLVQRHGCEAVVVISNPTLTRKVVYGLECRGVAAYGPIFDS